MLAKTFGVVFSATILIVIQVTNATNTLYNVTWFDGPIVLPDVFEYGCITTATISHSQNIHSTFIFGGEINDTRHNWIFEWKITSSISSSVFIKKNLTTPSGAYNFSCKQPSTFFNPNDNRIYITNPSYLDGAILSVDAISDYPFKMHWITNYASMPVPTSSSCSSIDIKRNIILSFGGFNYLIDKYVNLLQIFNITSQTWHIAASAWHNISHCSCYVYKDSFYTFGGYTETQGPEVLSEIYKYNISQNKWTYHSVENMNYKRRSTQIVKIDSHIGLVLIIGGTNIGNDNLNFVELFNASTESIVQFPTVNIDNLKTQYGVVMVTSTAFRNGHYIVIIGGNKMINGNMGDLSNRSEISNNIATFAGSTGAHFNIAVVMAVIASGILLMLMLIFCYLGKKMCAKNNQLRNRAPLIEASAVSHYTASVNEGEISHGEQNTNYIM